MDWVHQEHYAASTIHRVYLPSNIESVVNLKAICSSGLYFEAKKVMKVETAKEVRNIMETVVDRVSCS